MRTRSIVIYVLLIIVLAIGSLEGYLRWSVWQSIHNKTGEMGMLYATQVFNKRIWNLFLSENKVELRWVATANNFANSDALSIENLDKIAAESALPVNSQKKLLNFLLAEKDWQSEIFIVNTDEYGARYCATSRKKAKSEVWIFGSYQAFGHGVDDCETYSSQLEADWNQRFPAEKIVVRNFGLQSVVSITGLALLHKQLKNGIRPKAIIFDFGLVDLLMDPQNLIFEPQALFLNKSHWLYPIVEKASHWFLRNIAHHSYLYNLVLNRILEKNMKSNIELWRNVNFKVVELANRNKIPVLFLDQFHPAKIPNSEYEKLVSNLQIGDFLSVNEKLRKNISMALGTQNYKWLEEFGADFSDYYRSLRPESVYNADMIQINAIAHRAIAQMIIPILINWREKNASPHSAHN